MKRVDIRFGEMETGYCPKRRTKSIEMNGHRINSKQITKEMLERYPIPEWFKPIFAEMEKKDNSKRYSFKFSHEGRPIIFINSRIRRFMIYHRNNGARAYIKMMKIIFKAMKRNYFINKIKIVRRDEMHDSIHI